MHTLKVPVSLGLSVCTGPNSMQGWGSEWVDGRSHTQSAQCRILRAG